MDDASRHGGDSAADTTAESTTVDAVFGDVTERTDGGSAVDPEDILESFLSPIDLYRRIDEIDLPERLLRRIALDHPDERARARALDHPGCTRAILAAAAADISATVRTAVAHDPRTPAEALGELLVDGNRSVMLAAASNPSTTPSARVALARSNDPHLKMMAATGPLTAAGIDILLTTGDRDVRATVAGRDDLVMGHLLRLCEDPVVDVRLALARRLGNDRRADAHAVRRLAGDHDPGVRAAITGSGAAGCVGGGR